MKGIVLEIKNDRVVVLKNDGTFAEIHNRSYTVGQQITIQQVPYKKYLSMAACLLLVCTSIFIGHHLYFTPASYVYIDINPSFRLDLNCFDQVIEVVPMNEDAQAVLSEEQVSDRNSQVCIYQIVDLCRRQEFINEHNTDVELSITTEHIALASSVETASQTLRQENLEVAVYDMTPEENENALIHHASARRLRAVESYTTYLGGDLDSNFEILRGLTIDEIYEQIRAYRRDPTEHAVPQTEVEDKSDTSAEKPNTNTVTPETAEPPAPAIPEGEQTEPTSENKYTLPPARLRAIEAYTEFFGGTLEENVATLRGQSTEEIYAAIREARRTENTEPADSSE